MAFFEVTPNKALHGLGDIVGVHRRAILLICSALLGLQSLMGAPKQKSDASKANPQSKEGDGLSFTPAAPATGKTDTSAAGEHDGQHDFDFLFGRWKVHCRRLLHPLTGSNEWVEFDGTNVVHKVWDGRANIDEFEADTPSGHVEGMTIRTYSAKSHQWTIYWSNHANGTIDLPPMVGEFKQGRGEFYDAEDYNGRGIFVRFTWIVNSPDSCHWEQAFSADGGKNWETNFIWDLAREKE